MHAIVALMLLPGPILGFFFALPPCSALGSSPSVARYRQQCQRRDKPPERYRVTNDPDPSFHKSRPIPESFEQFFHSQVSDVEDGQRERFAASDSGQNAGWCKPPVVVAQIS